MWSLFVAGALGAAAALVGLPLLTGPRLDNAEAPPPSALDARPAPPDDPAAHALVEAALDVAEGADIIMVKPAGPYLDIIRDVRNATQKPIAAYQVSGEYAQLHAAAKMGWLDLPRTRHESLVAIKRAGADMILTYFAKAMAAELR